MATRTFVLSVLAAAKCTPRDIRVVKIQCCWSIHATETGETRDWKASKTQPGDSMRYHQHWNQSKNKSTLKFCGDHFEFKHGHSTFHSSLI